VFYLLPVLNSGPSRARTILVTLVLQNTNDHQTQRWVLQKKFFLSWPKSVIFKIVHACFVAFPVTAPEGTIKYHENISPSKYLILAYNNEMK